MTTPAALNDPCFTLVPSLRSLRPLRSISFVLVFCTALVALPGCENRNDRLAKIAAAAPKIGREATVKALRDTPEGGLTWLPDAAMLAHERFQKGEDAAALAAAVLDTGRLVQDRLDPHAFFLQYNLGALAYVAAARAFDGGNVPLAADLVTAGPTHWQTEAYWLKYPHHEALRAEILFAQGKTGEALHMLQDRADVTAEPVIVETLAELRKRKP